MYLAVDIGGTKTSVCSFASLDPKSRLQILNYSTSNSYTGALELLIQHLQKLSQGQKLQAIGISVASRLISGSRIDHDNNLLDYHDHNLVQDLKPTFSIPIYVENDAVCAALAEIKFGQNTAVSTLVHLIMSTGFGGAYLHRLDEKFFGFDLNPEYTLIYPGGLPHTHYQIKGLLGAYLAGRQLEAQVNQPLSALSNDHRIWDQVTHYLTMALVNFTQFFRPDIITFSGKLIQKRPFILDKVKQESQLYQEIVTFPPLKLSTISDNASLIGALTLCQA